MTIASNFVLVIIPMIHHTSRSNASPPSTWISYLYTIYIWYVWTTNYSIYYTYIDCLKHAHTHIQTYQSKHLYKYLYNFIIKIIMYNDWKTRAFDFGSIVRLENVVVFYYGNHIMDCPAARDDKNTELSGFKIDCCRFTNINFIMSTSLRKFAKIEQYKIPRNLFFVIALLGARCLELKLFSSRTEIVILYYYNIVTRDDE